MKVEAVYGQAKAWRGVVIGDKYDVSAPRETSVDDTKLTKLFGQWISGSFLKVYQSRQLVIAEWELDLTNWG